MHEIQLDSEETNVRNLLKFKQFQNLKQNLKSDSVVNHTIFGDDHTIFYLEVYVLIEAYLGVEVPKALPKWTPCEFKNPLASTKFDPNKNQELSKFWFAAT